MSCTDIIQDFLGLPDLHDHDLKILLMHGIQFACVMKKTVDCSVYLPVSRLWGLNSQIQHGRGSRSPRCC